MKITGDIGYEINTEKGQDEPWVTFKTGHYRDCIPSTDSLDIDSVKVSASKPW